MITVNKIIEVVQQDIAKNLNTFIATKDANLQALSFHDDAPTPEVDEYFMGIYLSSPEGEVFTSNGQSSTVSITLDCILNSSREDVNLPQEYLSYTLEYLNGKNYGIRSYAYTAVTARVDLGATVNAFAVALNITIGHAYDMD